MLTALLQRQSASGNVTYFDREPTADGQCPDALLVPLTLELSLAGERALSNLAIEVFAASPDSFAGYAFASPDRVEGPLSNPANAAPLLVVLEATGERIVLWLYRDSLDGELIGQLIAP